MEVRSQKSEVRSEWRKWFYLLPFTFYLLPFTCSYAQTFSGELAEVKGTVEIMRTSDNDSDKEGEKEWIPAVEGMPVQFKDAIKTSEKSSCNIELDDGSLVYVGEKTKASIEYLEITGEKHNSKISLWFGKILANISKLKETKMEVHSPTAVVAVRGTEFAVEVKDDEQKQTDVGVFDGEVAVKNSEDVIGAEEVHVKKDEETAVLKGRRPHDPTQLSEVMRKYKERNLLLKERVQTLKERLKRISPEKRAATRQLVFERFQKIRTKRIEQIRKKREIKRK